MSTTKKAKVDCSTSQLVVRSFIDFLNSVQPTPGTDTGPLDVAKECLINAFKLDASSRGNQKNPSLVGMLEYLNLCEKKKIVSDLKNAGFPIHLSSVDDVVIADPDSDSEPPILLGEEEWTSKLSSIGISHDELIGQYFAAVEKMECINSTIDRNVDDPIEVARVTQLFQEAFMAMERPFFFAKEMKRSEGQLYSLNDFSDSLKKQGNKARRAKQYNDAIKLYTCAVSICENNAAYFCNRAAALMHAGEFNEAVKDCEKAIEIDSGYSKAYIRLGSAYYAQGSYRDSIEKGFKKALQLDSSSNSVKDYIRMAEFKLATESPQIPKESNVPVEEESREPPYRISAANPTPRDLMNLRRSLYSAGVPVLRVPRQN